ncbi:MAG: Ig-like domain-containing protein, partial [Ktedonobacterales bacterium]
MEEESDQLTTLKHSSSLLPGELLSSETERDATRPAPVEEGSAPAYSGAGVEAHAHIFVPSVPSVPDAVRPHLPRLSRRTMLIAGGVFVAGGAALFATQEPLVAKIYWKLRNYLSSRTNTLPSGPMSTPRDVVIFAGTLAQGWQDRSWGAHTVASASIKHDGQPVITMQVVNWDGLRFVGDAHDAAGLRYVQCWVLATQGSAQLLNLTLLTPDGETGSVALGSFTQGDGITAGTWRLARVPLDALGFASQSVSGLVLQAGATEDQGSIALADLRIVYAPDLHPPVLRRAWAYDLGVITLAFDQPMNPVSAGAVQPYLLSAASDTSDENYPASVPVAPVGANYHSVARTVSLTLPKPLRPGGAYTVSVARVTDQVGVASSAGMRAQIRVTRQPLTVAVSATPGRAISPDI